MKKNQIVVLLTDFGVSDQYVASMKGVILSLAPRAVIVDLSHSISPQNITQAAFLLWSSHSYFPKETIFVCVVDPGVGTSRQVLCVDTGRFKFLAPDNGVLKYVLSAYETSKVNVVTNTRYFQKDVSRTFHGRDIFAPVAAHMLQGIPPRKLGPGVTPNYGKEEFIQVKNTRRKMYQGTVLHIDRFGNIITNFSCRMLPERAVLAIGRKSIRQSFATYGDAATKAPFMIIGSSGLIELSVHNGNAARIVRARLGQPIVLDTN
jgi:S-adenosylmethionine hydrolase